MGTECCLRSTGLSGEMAAAIRNDRIRLVWDHRKSHSDEPEPCQYILQLDISSFTLVFIPPPIGAFIHSCTVKQTSSNSLSI